MLEYFTSPFLQKKWHTYDVRTYRRKKTLHRHKTRQELCDYRDIEITARMNSNTKSTAFIYELQTSSKCLLWGGEYWNRWLQSNQPPHQQQQNGDILLMRISHECLAPLIASLVHVLKQHLQINNNNGEIEQSNKKRKVVCVGIAEGPYLPLAILALHALGLSTEGRAVM